VLRIAFQNIGGFPLCKNKLKDDALRCGISTYEFDVFGIAETSLDWRIQSDDLKLYGRTTGWWETLNINFTHNRTQKPITKHQWGGTAILSLHHAAHRVTNKGTDPSQLCRWCWTRYQGKKDHALRIFAAYCPNPPTGPLSVYSHYSTHFQQIQDDRCPRNAFIQDLCTDIKKGLDDGDECIVRLDRNADMQHSLLSVGFLKLELREAILSKYSNNGPSTFRRNQNHTPIDGIWISSGLNIIKGGYLNYDDVVPNTDHRCLWIDVSFSAAFGHMTHNIIRPTMRKLTCKDPRIVENFTKRYEKLATQAKLLEKVTALDRQARYPFNASLAFHYETLDTIQCQISIAAGKKMQETKEGPSCIFPIHFK
jgi:hypothetical protein